MKLNVDIVESVIGKLEFIDAIEVKDCSYRINFPVFLLKDVIEIESYINHLSERIGEIVIGMKGMLCHKISKLSCADNYRDERILYHVVCDIIFDGTAFEFFKERNIMTTSELKPGNRKYIIIAYEDVDLVESHSNKLLCSSNNYQSLGVTFNSFGDSNGSRKDMYRFFRLAQKSIHTASPFHNVNQIYNTLLDTMNQKLIQECGLLLRDILNKEIKYNQLTTKEMNLIDFIEELEYFYVNEVDHIVSIACPVFYDVEMSTIIKDISDSILSKIYPVVKKALNEIEVNASTLTVVRHHVKSQEMANEIWHQIFGATNEYLVKKGFVSLPYYKDGEGRYLRSIHIHSMD